MINSYGCSVLHSKLYFRSQEPNAQLENVSKLKIPLTIEFLHDMETYQIPITYEGGTSLSSPELPEPFGRFIVNEIKKYIGLIIEDSKNTGNAPSFRLIVSMDTERTGLLFSFLPGASIAFTIKIVDQSGTVLLERNIKGVSTINMLANSEGINEVDRSIEKINEYIVRMKCMTVGTKLVGAIAGKEAKPVYDAECVRKYSEPDPFQMSDRLSGYASVVLNDAVHNALTSMINEIYSNREIFERKKEARLN
jgi:hypothetical protein